MSVLIKGLNIKPCEDGFGGKGLVIIGYDDKLYAVAHEQIIPLPDHGDLIDRDEAVKRMTEWFRRLYKKYGEYDDYVLGFSAALYFIDEYKAVIPAERSEDVQKAD